MFVGDFYFVVKRSLSCSYLALREVGVWWKGGNFAESILE